MTGIVGYAIHQIVHLVFDIRTKYKHERNDQAFDSPFILETYLIIYLTKD
jgi:hypothetical protein